MNFDILVKMASISEEKHKLIEARKRLLASGKIVKQAFDTRRIDQETEYNPRRGLQNYNRSEQFITEAMSNKLKVFKKLKEVLDDLKKEFGKTPEWQDSYIRVLLNSLDRGLRTNEKDGDYTENQPGVGSLSYLEELLYVRYRLTLEMLTSMTDDKIRSTLLSKDEELVKKDPIKDEVSFSKREIETSSYDTLMEKLFGGIRATKENPNVERTVTITIKDKFNPED